MTQPGSAYEFVYRAQLAEAALDQAGRVRRDPSGLLDREIADKLSLRLLDDDFVLAARRMATVYTAVAAFENTVRDLVSRTLLEEHGEEWWNTCVSSDVRRRAETRQAEEEKNRFHSQRGEDPLTYTDLRDLLKIIRANWPAFEAFLPSEDWTRSVFDAVERSRNVIMHSGELDTPDIERVGIHIRDWITQVGA